MIAPPTVRAFSTLAGSAAHTCAIHTDRRAYCWLATAVYPTDVAVAGDNHQPHEFRGTDSAVAIAAGDGHACILRADGVVLCWGDDTSGQIGDGAALSARCGADRFPCASVPQTVSLDSGQRIKMISADGAATCALTVEGKIFCWGANLLGNLGDGTNRPRDAPVSVASIDDAIDISVGQDLGCAVREDGSVSCWGNNYAGQLGNPNVRDTCDGNPCSTVPVRVAGLTDVEKVSAGLNGACALRRGGRLSCWGWNGNSQVGDGTTIDRGEPVDVELDDVVAVYHGYIRSCALNGSGELFCWGFLPPGKSIERPTRVEGLTEPLTEISGGWYHLCARGESGAIYCWEDDPPARVELEP